MKNTLLFLGLIILLVAKSGAQPYTIKRLGVEDGLSSNYVVGITQDKQGCMWFATEGGLNKFDGRQFTVYKKYTSKLSANELNCVCADPRDNKVWIGTQREGLVCSIVMRIRSLYTGREMALLQPMILPISSLPSTKKACGLPPIM